MYKDIKMCLTMIIIHNIILCNREQIYTRLRYSMDKIINGSIISQKIKDDIKIEISKLNKKPCLTVVLIGDDIASQIYIKHKKIACEYTGIDFNLYNLSNDTTTNEILDLIHKLNNDKDINGILVQLPLPKHINDKEILIAISKDKDVDGFHPYNIGMLSTNNAFLKPCTPFGCITLLKESNVSLISKNALIISRSNIVGKPMAMMLLNEDATVTIAHSKTTNLYNLTKTAEIIIVAVGIMNFLKKDMINDGVILIDVGMHKKDGKLYGDIDKKCIEKASLITPVPKGVGPMTIASLMQNTLIAYKLQNGN